MISFMAFTNNDVKRYVKQALPFLLKENRFDFMGGIKVIRVSEFVLQGMSFNPSSHCRQLRLQPFVWPLIWPTDFIGLVYSDLICHVNHKGLNTEWYELEGDPKNILANMEDMIKNIKEIALPYLDDSSDLVRLASAEYQQKWSRFWGETIKQLKGKCLLYAYTRELDKFENTFRTIEPICSSDDRDWAIREWNYLNEVRDHIHDIDALKIIFKRSIEFCITGLKLEKYNINTSVESIMKDSSI